MHKWKGILTSFTAEGSEQQTILCMQPLLESESDSWEVGAHGFPVTSADVGVLLGGGLA